MKTSALFCFILLLTSCSNSSEYGDSSNYLSTYVYDVNQAKIIPNNSDEVYYSLYMNGSQAKWGDLNKQKYNSFAKLFNDESFNKSFIYMFTQPVLADTITKIDFICKQAFDVNHSQNSNINDLINISSCSVKEYLESGYTLNETFKVTREPLTSFNRRKHILMTSGFTFSFTQSPENLNSCDIICKVYRNNDLIFEVSHIYQFN